jgi:hypothetical protein
MSFSSEDRRSPGIYANKVATAIFKSGKPADHSCIESFNGKFRDE